MSLYIGNLPRHARQEDLESAFGTYGPCRIDMKKPGGYAFANYTSFADAERALKALSGLPAREENLKISWAVQQPLFTQQQPLFTQQQPLLAQVRPHRGEYNQRGFDTEHRRLLLSESRALSPVRIGDRRRMHSEDRARSPIRSRDRVLALEGSKMADLTVRLENRADRRCSHCGQLGHASTECMFVDADYRGPEVFERDRSNWRRADASRDHGSRDATWHRDRGFADKGPVVRFCSDCGQLGHDSLNCDSAVTYVGYDMPMARDDSSREASRTSKFERPEASGHVKREPFTDDVSREPSRTSRFERPEVSRHVTRDRLLDDVPREPSRTGRFEGPEASAHVRREPLRDDVCREPSRPSRFERPEASGHVTRDRLLDDVSREPLRSGRFERPEASAHVRREPIRTDASREPSRTSWVERNEASGHVRREPPSDDVSREPSRTSRVERPEASGHVKREHLEGYGSREPPRTGRVERHEASGHVRREHLESYVSREPSRTGRVERPEASGQVKLEALSPGRSPKDKQPPKKRQRLGVQNETHLPEDIKPSISRVVQTGLANLPRFKAVLKATRDSRVWVTETLKFFDEYRSSMVQKGESKRTALKEGRRFLVDNGLMLNKEKRSGPVPGVEVGQRFHYRLQLEMVGLHFAPQAGIDTRLDGGQSVATSIVFSGGYEDKFDAGDVVEFTGQGGMDGGKQTADQQLVRGNKAMKNAQDKGYPIRVIHGSPDEESPSKTVYIYAGLYTIFKSGEVVGRSGFKVWKFHLRRNPGQPPLVLDKR